MSASLVGSEMCIRDSSGRVRAPTVVRTVPWWCEQSHPPHQRIKFTVSYTHLTLPTICSV
eukprot:9457646-Alexandrium_andersonii.AAC.1